jgi:hypothetical protein
MVWGGFAGPPAGIEAFAAWRGEGFRSWAVWVGVDGRFQGGQRMKTQRHKALRSALIRPNIGEKRRAARLVDNRG